MIRYAKLTSNIDIALVIYGTGFADLLDGVFVTLPCSSAVDTLGLSGLASSPLLKANTMDVVPTHCLTPENIFWLIGLVKFRNTDRAVAFDWLTRTAVISDFRCCIRGQSGDWCVGEYFCELCGEEGKLVGQVFTNFEDINEDLFNRSQ